MNKEQQILDQLSKIIDPDLGKDIVSLGFVKDLEIDGGKVSFNLELTTPACPVKDQFRDRSRQLVGELGWVDDVRVTLSASSKQSRGLQQAGEGLSEVRHVLAVSSCKGGVGKSTVAVNLAFTLAAQGARVGIFDADVYGPSLPTMVDVPDFDGLYQRGNAILPVEHRGMKLMSFAYATAHQGGGPAVMRGPMVSQVVNQLITGTDWGELDYLVIDMPPGTGDIQLTICQLLPLTAAVIVTTPQKISFIDVVKGIQMFDKLKVPTIAVVENMSYFVCDNCAEKHYIFGQGAMRMLTEQFGIANNFEVPLQAGVAAASDRGVPAVIADPEGEVASIYRDLGEAIVREISRLTFGDQGETNVEYIEGEGLVMTTPDKQRLVLEPAEVRRACRCANCVHEFTGEQLLQPEDVPEDVVPKDVHSMGNYAVGIDWSDGHDSIYPYDALQKLAKG